MFGHEIGIAFLGHVYARIAQLESRLRSPAAAVESLQQRDYRRSLSRRYTRRGLGLGGRPADSTHGESSSLLLAVPVSLLAKYTNKCRKRDLIIIEQILVFKTSNCYTECIRV